MVRAVQECTDRHAMRDHPAAAPSGGWCPRHHDPGLGWRGRPQAGWLL